MAASQHPSYGIIAYISLLLNLDLSQLQVIRAASFGAQLLKDKLLLVSLESM